jgi:hypothetical protein
MDEHLLTEDMELNPENPSSKIVDLESYYNYRSIIDSTGTRIFSSIISSDHGLTEFNFKSSNAVNKYTLAVDKQIDDPGIDKNVLKKKTRISSQLANIREKNDHEKKNDSEEAKRFFDTFAAPVSHLLLRLMG